MSKLIHASSYAAYKLAYPDWETTTSSVYRAIAYTADGYIITHGKAMKTSVEGSINPWGLDLTLSGQTLEVSLDGIAKSVTLPVIGATNGNITKATITKGIIKIDHNVVGTAGSYGPAAASDSTINVPQIITTAEGHVSAVNVFAATLNRVKRNASTGSGALLFAPASAGTGEVNYNTTISVEGSTLSAGAFKENGKLLSEIYAKSTHESVLATQAALGHVKLSNSITTQTYSDGLAATPKAVFDSLAAAKEYANSVIGANNAMVFKGTVGTGGTIANLPTNGYHTGWTYLVSTDGTFAGQVCEAGDMIISIKDGPATGTTVINTDWTIVQTNVNGAVTAIGNLKEGQIIIGDGGKRGTKTLEAGTSGQVLKINSSGLPAWAADSNTNTWRNIQVNGTELLGTSVSSGALNFKVASDSGISLSGAFGTITIGSNFKGLGIFNAADVTPLISYSPTNEAQLAFYGGLKAEISGTKVTVGHINSITAQSTSKLGAITYSAHGHITGFTEVTSLKNPNAVSYGVGSSVTTYDGSSAKSFLIATAKDPLSSDDFTLTANHVGGTTTLTHKYLKKYRAVSLYETSAATTTISAHTDTNYDELKFKPGNSNITLKWDATNKAIAISAVDTNTWRKVTACKLGSMTAGEMLNSSIGLNDLEFSNDFAWSGDNAASAKIHMVWTEVSEDGTITYAV